MSITFVFRYNKELQMSCLKVDYNQISFNACKFCNFIEILKKLFSPELTVLAIIEIAHI